MSDYQKRQYDRANKLKDNYINDFASDIYDEIGYCDVCDRRLTKLSDVKLVCNYCQIITDIQFTLVKRKSKQGPVDNYLDDGDDFSIFSEHYSFKTRKEEKDPYIDSLKARGYQIISSSKK